ncbi:MAG: hypothetical protein OCD01_13930 [Fibrobacterales bacterium]
MNTDKNSILICPLDWGLGHATRCIPIINTLLGKGCHVHLASAGRSYDLLKKEYPELPIHRLSSYNITYSAGDAFFPVLKILPKIFKTIWKENNEIKKIVSQHSINAVISDNRFGCFHKLIPSVYITHQIMAKMPPGLKFLERFVSFLHSLFMAKFSDVWIPDLPGNPNLSGDLAHKLTPPNQSTYIGLLSRFKKPEQMPSEDIDLLVILSGPEPSRTLFENEVLKQLKELNMSATILLAKPDYGNEKTIDGLLTIYPHLNSREIEQLILRSKVILTRSGYTTLLELAVLGKKAIIVPTPGQTEQEYLAEKLHEEQYYFSQPQEHLDIRHALNIVASYPPTQFESKSNLLDDAIDNLLKKIS